MGPKRQKIPALGAGRERAVSRELRQEGDEFAKPRGLRAEGGEGVPGHLGIGSWVWWGLQGW